MNKEAKRHSSIGARQLTETECKKILPTYDKILEQINDFREDAASASTEDGGIPQKTNNIGVMGNRGTGKSSILKTLWGYLFNENKNDILLPVIIPENIAESGNLMSTIIGLLSDCVAEYGKTNKLQRFNGDHGHLNNCVNPQNDDLQKAYDNVVKQFCFIQQQYREILIGQYTSQSEYTRRSKEIFNADNEFLQAFNKFIETLLKSKHSDDKKIMIIIFIDDVDLSTNRCTDVIKTLLTFISHPRIITILSGDLNTFEESITIDLLRLDHALGSVANEIHLSPGQTILERARKLSHEYMKKVVPPAYRHNVLNWQLKSRGDYSIGVGDNPLTPFTLFELLQETICKHVSPGFFTTRVEGGVKPLPLVFHLFDDTSRGLNNVYNVLASLHNKDSDFTIVEKKTLIETIIASKSQLNSMKGIIDSIIVIGSSESNTYFRFDNYINYLADKCRNEPMYNASGLPIDVNQIARFAKNAVDCFTLFVLLELAGQLILGLDTLQADNKYIEAKNKTVWLLFSVPQIHGSSIPYVDMSYLEPNDSNSKQNYSSRTSELGKITLKSFICNSPFIYTLHLYEECVKNKYDIFKTEKDVDKNWAYHCIYTAFLSTADENGVTAIAEHYVAHNDDFAVISGHLSKEAGLMTVRRIFDGIADKLMPKDFPNNPNNDNMDMYSDRLNGNFASATKRYEAQYKIGMLNTIYYLHHESILDISKNTRKTIDIKPVSDEHPINISERERATFDKVCDIDKAGLWGSVLLEDVRKKLANRVIEQYKNVFKTKPMENYIAYTDEIGSAWQAFNNAWLGSSYTFGKRVRDKIACHIGNGGPIMVGKWLTCIALCDSLIYTSAWYGIPQARVLKSALLEAHFTEKPFDLDDLSLLSVHIDDPTADTICRLYTHYYARCYEYTSLNVEQKKIINDLSVFSKDIDDAFDQYRNKSRQDFNEKLAGSSSENAQDFDFETLFDNDPKGK